jgi:putative NADH-flavin reductase
MSYIRYVMNIAIVGATGFVGSKLLDEATLRGHKVTAITRSPQKLPANAAVEAVKADVNDVNTLVEHFRGKDAVIHAYSPAKELGVMEKIEQQGKATQTIIAAVKAADVKRLLAVGGAGSLYVSPGVRNMDQPGFPKEYEGGVKATLLIKEILMKEPELDWTYLSPSNMLVPGQRTGQFRLGLDDLLIGADGESRISVEDYAVAMIDELEHPAHSRKRFTVGY